MSYNTKYIFTNNINNINILSFDSVIKFHSETLKLNAKKTLTKVLKVL